MLRKNLIILLLLVLSWTVNAASADGDPVRGKALSIICVDCHGKDGLGDEYIPAIAGTGSAYFREALMSFKSGARVDEDMDMAEISPTLSDKDIVDLAAYYSELPGK